MAFDDAPLGTVVGVNGAKMTVLLTAAANNAAESAATGPAADFGGLVKVHTPVSSVIGVVTNLWVAANGTPSDPGQPMMSIEVLGEISDAADGAGSIFRRGVSLFPRLGAHVAPVSGVELGVIYAQPSVDSVRVGVVSEDAGRPAYLITDRLLGKHFAVLGTTGSGKSCTVTLILRSILSRHKNGHVVILDPHNEYATAFGEQAERISPANLHLTYWLMNFAELVATFVSAEGPDRQAETIILKQVILDARRNFLADDEQAAHVTVDTPIPFRLGDVEHMLSAAMGRLNRADSTLPYLRLLSRLEALRTDRRFEFMFSGLIVRDTMADVLSRLLRVPVNDRPATVIDLSGVPSEIVDVLVSLIARMIFDFALWSIEAKAVPVLLVCDEAHRYVPQDGVCGFPLTRNAVSRIAKEGRKYGVSLCLVSQRPAELSATLLSQCNTIFAMRLSNEQDQEFVRRILPDGASGLLAALPALHDRECVAVGEGVSVPMRLRFDELEASARPRSSTACFASAWEGTSVDRDFVTDTIDRWRRQERDSDVVQPA